MAKPAGGTARRDLAAVLLSTAGLVLAAMGASSISHDVRTASLVAIGTSVRDSGSELTHAELLATAGRLEAASATRTAEEAGALAFLYYAAAQASRRAGDSAATAGELATSRRLAVETLTMAPTRADVSLLLATVEFTTGQARQAIEAPLLLSYETAPRELWIAERRIWLGLRLAATGSPELRSHIVNDIRTMGAPFHSANLYLELAQAARAAGIYAIALVRHELAAIHNQPLQAFNIYLAQLDAEAAAKKP